MRLTPPVSPSVSSSASSAPRGQSAVDQATVTAQQLQSIPCPNLRTLVNEAWLTPDKNGLVQLDQLDAALKRLGVESIPRKALVGGAQGATKENVAAAFGELSKTTFNVYGLVGSNLDHAGDTRILRGGFNAERLDWLCSFANDNGRIGMKALAAAQKETRNDEPANLRDKALGVVELVALLKVYGTKDASGEKTLSIAAVRDLYQNARFPEEWKAQLSGAPTVSQQKIGLMGLIGGIVDMAYRQIGTSSGRAQMGMDLSLARDPQLNQTSAMGLAQSLCPAGPPVATPKTQVDQSHAAAT
jgi:hypothetical protein